MKKITIQHSLISILIIELIYIVSKSKEIFDKLIQLQHLKTSFISSPYNAIWFYGPSILSLLLVIISSVLLIIGLVKYLKNNNLNKELRSHIFINFLFLLFCLTLTLFKGQSLISSIGVKIINNIFFAIIVILAVRFYYLSIKNKNIEIENSVILKTRFINLIVDKSILLIIIILIKDILFFNFNNFNQTFISNTLLIMIVSFLYYFTTELFFKQTFGKLLTNSQISSSDNQTKTVFIRAICRLIPFNEFSPFIGDKIPWHDKFSNSTVIELNNIKNYNEFP